MIFSDRPADVNALLAQASTVVKALNNPSATPASPASAAPKASIPSAVKNEEY